MQAHGFARPFTRRRFTIAGAAALAAPCLPAQTAMTNVAEMERPRVLADVPTALTAKPRTLRDFSVSVAELTAAYVLTQDPIYANRAGQHLNTWLVDPKTRVSTAFTGSVVDLAPLAEVARATSFLIDTAALPGQGFAAMKAWFAALLNWMTTAREPLIERDMKDHRASAWLLLAAAIARSQADESMLDDCRHRFHKPTLRNQIAEDGSFPQELATPNPYRDTLFNFDLLTGACQLLSSPFDDLWNFELADGPGMRSVAAFLYPLIQDPRKWPYVADAEHFHDLPGRRPALLFCGRAYGRPEYVDLWDSTPDIIAPGAAATFPIRQPLLWTTRAAHGL